MPQQGTMLDFVAFQRIDIVIPNEHKLWGLKIKGFLQVGSFQRILSGSILFISTQMCFVDSSTCNRLNFIAL